MGAWTQQIAATEKPPRLLILDDSPFDLKQASEFFSLLGYEVVAKRAGHDFDFMEDIASLIREVAPDCILTDFNMGLVNGLDTLDAAKAVAPNIPVIMHSSVPSDASKIAQKPLSELVGEGQFLAIYEKSEARKIDAAFKQFLRAQQRHIRSIP